MGRRSRKRMSLPGERRPGAPRAAESGEGDSPLAEDHAGARRREPAARPPVSGQRPLGLRPRKERPPAPWGRFPLVELCVLLALIIGGIGLASGGNRGTLLIVCAAALGSLAGIQQAIHDHFTGYRSHTLVLSGAVAMVLATVIAFVVPSSPVWLVLVIAVIVFAAAAWWLQSSFRRRSGGYVVR